MSCPHTQQGAPFFRPEPKHAALFHWAPWSWPSPSWQIRFLQTVKTQIRLLQGAVWSGSPVFARINIKRACLLFTINLAREEILNFLWQGYGSCIMHFVLLSSFVFSSIWVLYFIPQNSLFHRKLAREEYKGYLGLVATKPVFGVSDKARLKPAFSATKTS